VIVLFYSAREFFCSEVFVVCCFDLKKLLSSHPTKSRAGKSRANFSLACMVCARLCVRNIKDVLA